MSNPNTDQTASPAEAHGGALALAHRIAWRYKKSSDPAHSDTYTFNEATLLQFVAALESQAQPKGTAIGDKWPLDKFTTRQRAWCTKYEALTDFEPLMCDFIVGNESFVEAAQKSVKWYEDHTGDMYLAITQKPIPGSAHDMGDDE